MSRLQTTATSAGGESRRRTEAGFQQRCSRRLHGARRYRHCAGLILTRRCVVVGEKREFVNANLGQSAAGAGCDARVYHQLQ